MRRIGKIKKGARNMSKKGEKEIPTFMICPNGHKMEWVNRGHRYHSKNYDTVRWDYDRYYCKECDTHYFVTIDISV